MQYKETFAIAVSIGVFVVAAVDIHPSIRLAVIVLWMKNIHKLLNADLFCLAVCFLPPNTNSSSAQA